MGQLVIHYVVREALFGLEFLHEKAKICHRDIKGANLFIGDDYSIKFANFTLSCKANMAEKKRFYFIKSPHYMAPEVVKSRYNQYDNPKSDIWSLGITCIEMAERYPPLSTINPNVVISEINMESFRPSIKHPHKWSSSFIDFVNICLNRTPDFRPSASELLIVIDFFSYAKN